MLILTPEELEEKKKADELVSKNLSGELKVVAKPVQINVDLEKADEGEKAPSDDVVEENHEIVVKSNQSHEITIPKCDENMAVVSAPKVGAVELADKVETNVPSKDEKQMGVVSDVKLFREELKKDVETDENKSDNVQSKEEKKDEVKIEPTSLTSGPKPDVSAKPLGEVSAAQDKVNLPIEKSDVKDESHEKPAGVDGLNIVNVARTGAELGVKIDQSKSMPMEIENDKSSGVIDRAGEEGGAAIMIEGTFTPQQLRSKKTKLVVEMILTIIIVLAIGAVGYIYGWPILKDFLKTI